MRRVFSHPWLQSLRVRLTLWYVALLATVLLLFSGALYLRLNQTLYDNLDDTLRRQAEVLTGSVEVEGGVPRLGDVGPRGGRMQGESFTRLFNSAGAVVSDDTAAIGTVPTFPADVAAVQHGVSAIRSVTVNGTHLRVLTAPLREAGQGAIQIGIPEDDVRDTLAVLFAILAVLVPVMLLIASGGGLFLARRALVPVDRMTTAAQAIEATDLHQRLPEPPVHDEVGRLARTLNALIARLDAAFTRQRQFTADASHELRTPLTILRGELDVTLRRERTGAEYRDTLAKIREQVIGIETLTADLLLLARSDAPLTTHMARVDLAAVAAVVCAPLAMLAEAGGQTLTLDAAQPVVVAGIGRDLERLVRNLVENAIHYTPSGGAITVAVNATEATARLVVADTGPGIAADALPHLFERFYRADAARNRATGGTGLGLAIVGAIVQRHRGAIGVTSAIGEGSVFTVTLPAVSEARAASRADAALESIIKE